MIFTWKKDLGELEEKVKIWKQNWKREHQTKKGRVSLLTVLRKLEWWFQIKTFDFLSDEKL